MKIKRFFAPDIRQAIKMVRDELGPDAVILSNRSINGGVEIVSAVDYDEGLLKEFDSKAPPTQATQVSSTPAVQKYDLAAAFNRPVEKPKPVKSAPPRVDDAPRANEVKAKTPERTAPNERERERKNSVVWSQDPALVEMREEMRNLRGILETQLAGLAWGDLQRRFPLRVELLQKLTKLGMSAPLCKEIAEEIHLRSDRDAMWHDALDIFTKRIVTTDDDILNQGGVVALVGPTGVGKTTTVAKLAARYALRHGARHVALVTTDAYRIGAYDQLRAYGRILDVPVRLASTDEELRQTLDDLSDRRLVLIDTTGMSQRDLRLPEQLRLLNQGRDWLKIYVVMSTTTRLSSLEDILGVYAKVKPAGCILTKIDETTCLGSALSAVITHRLPIAYFSDGQRVPEDLHMARAPALVQRAVTIMQQHEALLEEEMFTNVVGRPAADAHA